MHITIKAEYTQADATAIITEHLRDHFRSAMREPDEIVVKVIGEEQKEISVPTPIPASAPLPFTTLSHQTILEVFSAVSGFVDDRGCPHEGGYDRVCIDNMTMCILTRMPIEQFVTALVGFELVREDAFDHSPQIISAIKVIRHREGFGLKDAKDAAESLRDFARRL
jgi:hypothetical protein